MREIGTIVIAWEGAKLKSDEVHRVGRIEVNLVEHLRFLDMIDHHLQSR